MQKPTTIFDLKLCHSCLERRISNKAYPVPRARAPLSIRRSREEDRIDCCILLAQALIVSSSPPVRSIRQQKWESLRIVLVRTVSANIVLVVQVLGILLRMALRLLAVNVVQTFGLDELVDLGARNADEEFLRKLVRDGLACSRIH